MNQTDLIIKYEWTLNTNSNYVGIYVDNNYIGKIRRGENIKTSLEPGTHNIVVKQSFRSGSITIKTGENKKDYYSFRPTYYTFLAWLFILFSAALGLFLDIPDNQMYVLLLPASILGIIIIGSRQKNYYIFKNN